jgi:predicted kinase
MKKLKVLILIGVPASGKSTWSLDFVRTNPDWVRVSRDDFRFMLKGQPVCDPRIELLINTIQDSVILDALAKGINVVIDNTNLKKKYIEHFAKLVQPYASVEFQIFDISLNEALERDESREKKVGKEVLERMFKQYENLVGSFDSSGRPMKKDL